MIPSHASLPPEAVDAILEREVRASARWASVKRALGSRRFDWQDDPAFIMIGYGAAPRGAS